MIVPPFTVRPGCIHFDDWAPITQDEKIKRDDKWICVDEFSRKSGTSSYINPQTAYHFYDMYIGETQVGHWGPETCKKFAIYRYVPGYRGMGPGSGISQKPPHPLNKIFSQNPIIP